MEVHRKQIVTKGSPIDASSERTSLAPVREITLARLSPARKALLALVVRQAIAFYDLITDPPMTERDRIKRSIADARAEARKRHLLRRY